MFRPTLIQFDFKCLAEAANESLPFLSIGSGQKTADPFLALIRRTFWPTRLPNIAEGVFAAVWTLRQTIETSTGGVANPKQVIVVTGEGAKELPDNELDEHEQNAKSVEDYLGAFKSGFSSGTEDVPAPPAPPT